MSSVPPEILEKHGNVTLCVNIIFINKISFVMTISRNIGFCTADIIKIHLERNLGDLH